jgi:hypothetical protein
MILERFPELEKLSLEERALLYSELGETLFDDRPSGQSDATILELLEHRHQEYLKNPELARPAEEVLARLRSRYIDRTGA